MIPKKVFCKNCGCEIEVATYLKFVNALTAVKDYRFKAFKALKALNVSLFRPVKACMLLSSFGQTVLIKRNPDRKRNLRSGKFISYLNCEKKDYFTFQSSLAY